MRVLTAAALLVAALSLPILAAAQDYSDWQVMGGDWDKSYSVGFQLGIPLVAGVDIAKQFSPRLSVGLGFGFVPDLIALGGQMRINILQPAPEKMIPIIGLGLNQYWLEEDQETAEAVALHVFGGVERLFGSEFGLGMFLGYTRTLTDTDNPDIKVWGVNDDMSDLYLSVAGRYYF